MILNDRTKQILMGVDPKVAAPNPVGRWGRFPTYQAKVGTMPGTTIVVKRARKFHVDQWINFADVCDLRGMSTGMTPRWRGGIIWKIEDNRIFVNLN